MSPDLTFVWAGWATLALNPLHTIDFSFSSSAIKLCLSPIAEKMHIVIKISFRCWHFGLQKLYMIINLRLLSSPMIVNQRHSERINQLLVPTLRPSASAPALGVDWSCPRAIDFPIIGSFGAYDFLNHSNCIRSKKLPLKSVFVVVFLYFSYASFLVEKWFF